MGNGEKRGGLWVSGDEDWGKMKWRKGSRAMVCSRVVVLPREYRRWCWEGRGAVWSSGLWECGCRGMRRGRSEDGRNGESVALMSNVWQNILVYSEEKKERGE